MFEGLFHEEASLFVLEGCLDEAGISLKLRKIMS